MSAPRVSARSLLALSASAFVVLAAEPLYLLVDTAVVGHRGASLLAALGIGAAALELAVLAGSFVDYGTTSRSARFFGAADRAAAVNEGVQASWLAVMIGLAVVGLGEIVVGPLVHLLCGSSHQSQLAPAAQGWLRIALLGLPAVLLVLAGNGWMRGVQITRKPVLIVVTANVLSAALCPIMVYSCRLGLDGSALANVVGQYVGAALFVRALRHSGASPSPQWPVMRAQLVLGRDLLVRSVAFQVAFLCAAAVAARMGAAEIAAHQIGLQLWNFTALLLDSFAIAAQSSVGAALGAYAAGQARQVAGRVARWGGYAGAAVGLLFAGGWLVIPRLFTSDVAVLTQVHAIWPWLVVLMPAAGVVFALDGVLIGAGDVGYLRSLTLIAGVGFFAPLTLAALHWHWGLRGVWSGLGVFVLVRLIGMLLRTRGQRWVITGALP